MAQALTGKGLRSSYDREAVHYDERRYQSVRGRLFSELETDMLLSWLDLGPASRLLDMPAGTGRFSLALASTGATVVGVDISANMLKEAARKTTAGGTTNVHLAQGSGTKLPFPDNTFDAVMSFKFFHLIPNELKLDFIREMTRVLKPGRPLVVEFNSPYYGGILAWIRYTFMKKHPGGMRMKCLFPDQIPALFEGMEVTRTQGIQPPFSGLLTSILGRDATAALSRWLGRLPALKYLSYAVMVEARKPVSVPHQATRHSSHHS